jgi:alpha-glucoside transport system substrate-binding protein
MPGHSSRQRAPRVVMKAPARSPAPARYLRLLPLLIAFLILGCEGAAAPTTSLAEIRVLASWEGPEIDAFRDAVAPFEERTGHTVVVSTTRDLKGALERAIASGDPPDLAGLPGPGYMLELVHNGHLADLTEVIDVGVYKNETAPGFVELGTVDGQLVGVFMKGTVKGLLWYDPDVYQPEPVETWAELQHDAMTTSGSSGIRPWCVGLASDAASGWPGTDWIEDFVLRQSGPEVYDAWVAGQLAWDSPEIRQAFGAYSTVVNDTDVAGGVEGALRTHFSDTGDGLFSQPPACLFVHQGSFMSTFLDESVERLGGRYDWLPFPDVNPAYRGALIGAGDLFALTSDSPAARELLRYLVSVEAQQLLVARGGAVSGNLRVSEYPDEMQQRLARLLGDARIFRFDASDSMPDLMNEAFWQAVLDYTADPGALDHILEQLDAVRAVAYEP